MNRSFWFAPVLGLITFLSLAAIDAPLLHAQGPADAAERIARLETENKALRAQVEQLQTENKRLAVMAGVVPKSDDVANVTPLITTQTDPQTHKTTVSTPVMILHMEDSTARHLIDLNYSKEGSGAPHAVLSIRTYFSGTLYFILKQMTWTIDGQTVTTPVGSYRNNYRTIGGKVSVRNDDEFLTFDLPMDVVARIGNATDVKGELGRMHFKLTREQIALFRAMDLRSKS